MSAVRPMYLAGISLSLAIAEFSALSGRFLSQRIHLNHCDKTVFFGTLYVWHVVEKNITLAARVSKIHERLSWPNCIVRSNRRIVHDQHQNTAGQEIWLRVIPA